VTGRDDRAVSEVLGFILSFSVILLSVGIVYTAGFDAMGNAQADVQAETAEEAMTALADTFGDLARGRGSVRESEVRVGGAAMEETAGSSLEIRVQRASGATTYVHDTRGLSYRLGDERSVVYDSGAVIRATEAGARIVQPPTFVCRDSVAVVSLVRIGSGTESISTDGAIRVTAQLDSTSLVYPGSGSGGSGNATAVEVTVLGSPYAGAWTDYFREHPNWAGSGPTFTCTATDVYVRTVAIDVGFTA
jgi:hypothetical protein